MSRPMRRGPSLGRRPSALGPVLALLLVLITAATALGLPGPAAPPLTRPAQALQASPGAAAPPLIAGDDACALLPDDDVLLVTGGLSIVSRTPGPQTMLPSGCLVSVEPVGEAYGTTWDLALGVQVGGGSERYDQEGMFFESTPVAGIGDRARSDTLVGGWSAVTGDTYLTLQVLAFGGDKARSPADMGRLLLWRAVTRLEAERGSIDPNASVPPTAPPTPSPVPIPAEQALVERLRAATYGPDVEDATIEILARSGIPTYDAPDAPEPVRPITGPESPMALLRDQVRAIALEAWAGSGYSGGDLDALIPAQPDLASGAEVVAGYVAGAETEGAGVARLLVPEAGWSDPSRLVVPQLVLVLLVSDVARDTQAATATAGRGPAAPQPVRAVALAIHDATDARTAQGGPCSAVLGFIDSVLTKVFDTLRLGESKSAIGQVVVSIWNMVVSIAEGAARKLIKQITQPVLDLIAEVAATVGLASMIVSAIRPWTLAITADPAVAVKGIGGAPGQEGRWVARVDLGGFDEWPDAIQDCATAAGRPLPNLKPEGAPVAWSVIGQQPGGLVIAGKGEEKLDKDGTARFTWTTGVDDIPEPWQERPGWIGVTARVDRPAIKELRQLAIDELLSHIPTLVRDTVVPYVRPILDRVTAQLDTLLSSQSSGQGTVIYHVPGETPEPGAAPPPSRGVMVVIDRPGGSMGLAGRTLELISCTGPYGSWSGVLRLGGLSSDGLEVPFADFPMAFRFPGAGGVRSTQTSIAGTVGTNVPNLSYDIAADLTVSTNGRTLSITGLASGSSSVIGVSAELGGGQLRNLPIVPAPPGTCS